MEYTYEKELLVSYCKKAYARGLVSASGGNASMRIGDIYLMTPSGYSLGELTIADVCVLDCGLAAVCECAKPTSEKNMHKAIYDMRSDVMAILHTHSPAATSFAYLNRGIHPVNPEGMVFIPELPIAPYKPYGSDELAIAASQAIGSANAVLLEKHGVLAVGKDLREAYNIADLVEETARMNIYVMQIDPNAFSKGGQ